MPPRGYKRPAAAVAVAPAGNAQQAPPKRARSGRASVPPARVSDADPAADAQERRDIQAARAASQPRTDDIATPVLHAWVSDYEGHRLKPSQVFDRRAVLDELARTNIRLPATAQELEAHYRTFNSLKKGAPIPRVEDEQRDVAVQQEPEPSIPPLADYEDYEDEGDEEPLPQSQQQRPARAAAAAAAASSAPVSLSPPAPTALKCPHCNHSQMQEPFSRWFCQRCELRAWEDVDSPANQLLLRLSSSERIGQATSDRTAGAAATAAAAAAAAAVPALDKRDKEFERLAAAGPSLTRFASTTPVTSAAALTATGDSAHGAEYAAPSASLLKLIRAGKLDRPGHALPRRIDDANPLLDAADHVLTFTAAGGMQSSTTVQAPPLRDSRDLCLAFFATIGPALFDHPTALMDWCALMRTCLEMERAMDWQGAQHYLTAVLHRASARGGAFNIGTVDAAVMHSVQAAHLQRGRPTQAAPAARIMQSGGAAQAQTQRSAASEFPDMDPAACRTWNMGRNCRCGEPGAISRSHTCCWKECHEADKYHRGVDCSARPASASHGAPAKRGGRGGSRGGSTRGGGVPTARSSVSSATSTREGQ